MHTDLIDQQGEWWVIPALVEGTEQTILKVPDRDLPTETELLDTPGAGPSAPGQEGIWTFTSAGPSTDDELRRLQQ